MHTCRLSHAGREQGVDGHWVDAALTTGAERVRAGKVMLESDETKGRTGVREWSSAGEAAM